MPFTPRVESAFAAAVPKLTEAERVGGAKELAIARGLMERARQSGNPAEVAQAAEFAHHYGFSAGRIALGRAQSGVALARGGGQVAAMVEQFQPSDPRVTVDPQVQLAFVPDKRGTSSRGKGFVRQEQELKTRQGPDGLRELAGLHAQAVARPDFNVEHEYSPKLALRVIQLLAETVTGKSWHTELETSIPGSQPVNAAGIAGRIYDSAAQTALSQITNRDLAAAAANPGVQHAAAAEWEHVQASVAREAELAYAQVERDYGSGGRFENMSALDVAVATTAAWK